MRKFILIFFFVLGLVPSLSAQSTVEWTQYDPSPVHPYGVLHPDAPPQVADYAPLIGVCKCSSQTRNPDKSWAEPQEMIWKFKYIMNGKGVQDETLKADGNNSGSIRQYIADSARWYVHYYSSGSPSTSLKAWEGNRQDNQIVLYNEQAAPNGTPGFFKITFSEISEQGFNWLGEWVNPTETFSYPTWKINCHKVPERKRKRHKRSSKK